MPPLASYLILLFSAAALFPLKAVSQESGPADHESRTAARIAADARDFLDRLVGPGKSKILVDVEGEFSEIRTQKEVNAPLYKEEKPQESQLPGYLKPEKDKEVDSYQKDTEILANRTSFKIKRLTAVIVLDRTVDKEKENTVRRIFPQLLRMETERGDKMTILRADLEPPWRTALTESSGLRGLALFGGAAVLVLFVCASLYVTALRAVRTFAAELAARRAGAGPQTTIQNLPPMSGPDAAIDLGSGSLPSLSDPGEPPETREGREPLKLGRRFDFLAEKDPAEAADLLEGEKPDELALLFAYLAEADPEKSSRLFSQLPTAVQAETSEALMKLKMADPEKLALLESRLKTYVEFGVRGPDRLGSILSRLALEDRENILGELMSRDPEAAQAVERAVFPFESIADLKTPELRRLIMAVPYDDWGLALRGAASEVVEKVLSELPAGTRNIVRESVDSPQPREKVLAARSKVLQQIFSLVEKGQISLGREGASSEML